MNQEGLDKMRLQYPRVTEIISLCTQSKMDAIAPEVLKHASERGTKIHNYCTGITKGLWIPEIDEECQPYMDSFKHWFDINFESLVLAEKRLYEDDRQYTGEIDLVVKLKDGRLALVDLKTSATPSKSWSVQLAAYKRLLEKSYSKVDLVLNLQLRKTGGKAKEIIHSDKDLTAADEVFEANLKSFDFYFRKPIKLEDSDA